MNAQTLPQEEFFALLCETLRAGGTATFTPSGESMRPMLRSGRDKVTLRLPTEPLRRHDLPLYRRENGQYVLHRVLGRDAQGYLLRGDHQLETEHGITDGQIVGLVVAFERGGKRYAVTDRRYRLYCRLWNSAAVFFARRALRAVRARLHRAPAKRDN